MNLLKIKSLTTTFTGVALLAGSLLFPIAIAQDNSDGRYRPEGRTFARNAANFFDDRLYEARTYVTGTDVAEFASATIFYPLTLSFDRPNGGRGNGPGLSGYTRGLRLVGANACLSGCHHHDY